jgi:hypothetical protein
MAGTSLRALRQAMKSCLECDTGAGGSMTIATGVLESFRDADGVTHAVRTNVRCRVVDLRPSRSAAPWYLSKCVLGPLLVLLGAALKAAGVEWNERDQAELLDALVDLAEWTFVVGVALLGLCGRLAASRPRSRSRTRRSRRCRP